MNVTALEKRIFERLEEDPLAPTTYTEPEALHAINQAQYTLALLTLCLEKTAALTLQTSTAIYGIRGYLPDYLLPLRVTVGGQRIRPISIRDLDALDSGWQTNTWHSATGAPKRYGTLGLNLFFAHPQPAAPTVAQVTYAYVPATLTAGGDTPEVPEEYHEDLVRFALVWLRLKEGAQEFQKTAPLLKEFLASAGKLANYVRARSLAANYDRLPFQLEHFDASRLFKAIKKRGEDAKPAAG